MNKPDLISPWVPMAEPVDSKHIGKLLEELGEAVSAASRCFIQGMEGTEPVTGKLNKEWLEDELADIVANIHLNVEHFKLDEERMKARTERKIAGLRRWHRMLVRRYTLPQPTPAALQAMSDASPVHIADDPIPVMLRFYDALRHYFSKE